MQHVLTCPLSLALHLQSTSLSCMHQHSTICLDLWAHQGHLCTPSRQRCCGVTSLCRGCSSCRPANQPWAPALEEQLMHPLSHAHRPPALHLQSKVLCLVYQRSPTILHMLGQQTQSSTASR